MTAHKGVIRKFDSIPELPSENVYLYRRPPIEFRRFSLLVSGLAVLILRCILSGRATCRAEQ